MTEIAEELFWYRFRLLLYSSNFASVIHLRNLSDFISLKIHFLPRRKDLKEDGDGLAENLFPVGHGPHALCGFHQNNCSFQDHQAL